MAKRLLVVGCSMNNADPLESDVGSDHSVLVERLAIASDSDDPTTIVHLPSVHPPFTHIRPRHHFPDAWCFFRASADSGETGAAGATGDRRGLTDAGECLRY